MVLHSFTPADVTDPTLDPTFTCDFDYSAEFDDGFSLSTVSSITLSSVNRKFQIQVNDDTYAKKYIVEITATVGSSSVPELVGQTVMTTFKLDLF